MKKTFSYIALFAKDYRTMTSGWRGAPYLRRYGQMLVSKPTISSKKIGEGYRRTTLITSEIPTPTGVFSLKDPLRSQMCWPEKATHIAART